MNLNTLLSLGLDAACAFAALNVTNALRRGWLLPGVHRWLNVPRSKPERRRRVIGLALIVAIVVSGLFALRSWAGDPVAFAGEWTSRALLTWLLSMGQFDAVKLLWPKMFDPSQAQGKEDKPDDSVDQAV